MFAHSVERFFVTRKNNERLYSNGEIIIQSHIFRFSPCSEISQSVISHHVTSKICLHRSTITTVHVFCSFISYVPASLQHFTSALKLTCRWLYAIVSLNNEGKKREKIDFLRCKFCVNTRPVCSVWIYDRFLARYRRAWHSKTPETVDYAARLQAGRRIALA